MLRQDQLQPKKLRVVLKVQMLLLLQQALKRKVIKLLRNLSEKIIVGSIKADKVKECPSTPSLFFIGSGETETGAVNREELEMEEEEEGDVGGLSGPELFTKAEIFIGNFYKQLKMQREESWKKIHGFYQKTF
ncbi:hypothetical protein ES332_A01G099100v1 [Gossypium tomentosum]|uniref:Uncharacterized protein n=1 Tax=Gossypium tomentosum TaxID=34277 RepID=A0A5D2RPL7_GOSTO|nr:hypothetical protein ES332_A01G099100v1 [Gossypium tomentosum]